jgi:hypothetical protein
MRRTPLGRMPAIFILLTGFRSTFSKPASMSTPQLSDLLVHRTRDAVRIPLRRVMRVIPGLEGHHHASPVHFIEIFRGLVA